MAAAGARIFVLPSGKLQTALTCCSNWLVSHASIVRCPELCGRGATSLIITFSEETKNSTHNKPTTPSVSAARIAMRHASAASSSGTDAGAIVKSRMWLRCEFSKTGKVSLRPSAVRATMTEISRSKSMRCSAIHASIESQGTDSASLGESTRYCPLPS